MASKELSILLTAKDMASKTIGQVGRNVKKLDTISGRAGRGMGILATNLKRMAAIGIGAGIGILAVSVKNGIQSLATLETAVTSVDGAIKQMGQTGQVSGKQIAGWANEIEGAIGAAFDDKAITASTATLIRYGKVAPKNLQRAMVVMTDLAAKTGSVESASTLLAKALADPAKAAGKLARAGVILTKVEQKKIAALVKAGKAAEAQEVILASLERTTKGAAEASQGPYQRSLSTLGDAVEDAQRALGEGFLPVITKVAEWLKKGVSDPGTMSNIRALGQNLAGAFDSAVDFAKGIDWKAMGDGLKVAADWAKKLFDAFMSLPPEAKGILLALGGLDKLSGGAVSGIVGELSKGLIKGVLGMTAGVVNLNAAVVNGPGGVPGGKGGKVGGLAKGAGAAAGLGAVGAVGAATAGFGALALTGAYGIPALVNAIYGNTKGNDQRAFSAGGGAVSGANAGMIRMWTPALTKTEANTKEQARKQQESLVAFRSGERTSATGLSTVATTTRAGAASAVIAQASAASRIVSAVSANGKPIVNVYVSVPGANVRYGSSTGSAGSSRDRKSGRGV